MKHQFGLAVRLRQRVLDAWRAWQGQTRGCRSVRLRVSGDSMAPRLPAGSEILVRMPAGRIKRGTLIAYRLHGEMIVHRVVGVKSSAGHCVFLTKGDNNVGCDRPVREDAVVGQVVEASLPEDRAGRREPRRGILGRLLSW